MKFIEIIKANQKVLNELSQTKAQTNTNDNTLVITECICDIIALIGKGKIAHLPYE